MTFLSSSTSNPSSSVPANGRSTIDDSSSNFFLHHSDSPGLVLVSQPLARDNYASWSKAMLIAFSVKNKLGFMDGTIAKPDSNDGVLLQSWIRNNNMVIS